MDQPLPWYYCTASCTNTSGPGEADTQLRQLRASLSLTQYPNQKGSKETDDVNEEGMQVTQVKKGLPEPANSLCGGRGGKQRDSLESCRQF